MVHYRKDITGHKVISNGKKTDGRQGQSGGGQWGKGGYLQYFQQ